MSLTLRARENLGDVVEAADQAGTQVEALRSEPAARRTRLSGRFQTGPEQVVHDDLEGLPALADDLVQPRRDVLVERERGSHIKMLRL